MQALCHKSDQHSTRRPVHAVLLQDFVKIFPEKFQNKTNGVTPRRWLAFCNPELSALITETLGSDAWMKELDLLQVRWPKKLGKGPGPAAVQAYMCFRVVPYSSCRNRTCGPCCCVVWQGLKPHAEDAEFRKKWAAIKFHNKQALAAKIKEWTGIEVPVAALYDIHIKRIHEYKRQYMNIVSVIYRYKQIKVGTVLSVLVPVNPGAQ